MARWALFLFVLGGLLAFAAAASGVDLDEVMQAVMRLDAGTWLAVLGLSLVNYVLRFGRWHAYLRDLGHKVPAARHLAIYVSGFALTPTPGKVGEAMRALYLKPFGITLGRSLSTLYAERVLDIMVVSALAALLYLAPVSDFRWLALVGGAIVVLLLAAQLPAVLSFTRRVAQRLPEGRWRNIGERLVDCQRDVSTLVRAELLAFGFVMGVAAWAAEGIGFYLVVDALGIDLGLWPAVGIYAAAMLAGALSFVPGGLGSAEATMIGFLVLAGAPLPAAIAATLLSRIATLWFAVALGAAAWLGLAASPTPASVAVERDSS